MKVINHRLTGRGRRGLAGGMRSQGRALSGVDIPPPPPPDQAAPVVRPGEATNADAARHSHAIESAWGIFPRPAAKVRALVGRAGDRDRKGRHALAEARRAESRWARAETAVDGELEGKSKAELDLLHRSPVARLEVPLILLFGLADAAALFYAAQFALNLEDDLLGTSLTVLMALLGLALVLPAMWLAQLLKRIYVSRLDDEVVPRNKAYWRFAVIPLVLLAASLYAVAWIRVKGGSAEIDWFVMVIFTALATFGALAVEFMADVPHRRLLDRVEHDARRERRRHRRHARRAIRHFGRRDVAIKRAQATFSTLRAQVELARSAAITDTNTLRAAQPGVYGTNVIEDVTWLDPRLEDMVEELGREISDLIAAIADDRDHSMGPPEPMSSHRDVIVDITDGPQDRPMEVVSGNGSESPAEPVDDQPPAP